jgi:NACHT domain- and WD repeat-containing protein
MTTPTRTFRIFVSSTFSDLKEERNALQKSVFPRLRELCMRHGCRFQAIDLRWGVREEAGLDQQTMKICLDEVSRSQRASPRPNFIVLLGDRYGWRPLPAEIPAHEFIEIENHVADQRGRSLLATWYRRDENALPTVYCLQPRQDRFADFKVWEEEVERPLRETLQGATSAMDLALDERLKYEASATEQEIAAGALKVADAKEHVFCYFRGIERLPLDETARDFADLDEHGVMDAEAGKKLESLKARLEARLPGNIHHYQAEWTEGGLTTAHIGTLPADLDSCLKLLEDPDSGSSLCLDVWRRLARVILDEVARLEAVDPIEKEISDHHAFGQDRAKLFVGRASILKATHDYVCGGNRHPMAFFGDSGCGKSAVMARAAHEVNIHCPGAERIVRFIGATPSSSQIRGLLEGICRQISRSYGGDEASVPTDYRELIKELPQRLAVATPERPLIIFLDALDQFSDADHARNLAWLPSELPENVRCIVSTLPGECLSALERKLPPSNLLKIEPMSTGEGGELLRLWLQDASRTLQVRQKEEVLGKFDRCGLPLYLKLAFEEARRWKSYSENTVLSGDIPGVIRGLFERLSSDASHGRLMVSRSLGYLAAAKNGLTEDELLDVLSRDKEVFLDFQERARHKPPEERLPVIVWSRLYFDIEPYLTERSADGTSLISFYHRQLRDVIETDHLSGDQELARHASLADYFTSLDLFDKGKKTANLRKLSELPYQQTCGGQWDELYATLTDFDFLEAKCTYVAVVTSQAGGVAQTIYGGVYELQEDYRFALERFPS